MRLDNPRQLFRPAGRTGLAALLLALGACATFPEPEPANRGGAVAIARDRLAADQVREAVTVLERAATLQPARKEPWLAIARLRAGQGRHVDALAAAQQVLRRDPSDQAAHEIMIDSGLQVSLRTMQRLRASGQAPGEERSLQAEAIAQQMAEVFGPEVLIPAEARTHIAQEAVEKYKATRSERLLEAQETQKGDPLDLLGGD